MDSGGYFGNRVIELSGIVIHPDFQNMGIGKKLVNDALNHFNPEMVTSFTRNPSVLRLLEEIGDDDIFNQNNKAFALTLPNVTAEIDGYNYHIDRFGPNGLYGANDPAEQIYKNQKFMEKFVGLKNICNALALAVNIKREEAK